MFKVIEKETGKIRTVYGVDGDKFLVEEDGEFRLAEAKAFTKFSRESAGKAEKQETCVFLRHEEEETELGEMLDRIASGETPVSIGDSITIHLADGQEVDLVVTNQDEETVRLESRDCLSMNTSAKELPEFLDRVYALLPEALKKRISEVKRAHMDGEGNSYTETGKLFVPAASEMFSPEECYGDEGLYTQLDWYKDVHNRVRMAGKNGDAHWYWTSSPSNATSFCYVYDNGTASNGSASDAYGVAPFGCILPKTE